MEINGFKVGGKKTYIIAEIGNNHNGSFSLAKEMIDQAVEAGVDCVKFQMRHMEKTYRQKTLKRHGDDLGTEYILDLLERFELSVEEHSELFNYCSNKDITYLCTPWDEKSADVLNQIGVSAFKVASADLTNFFLINHLIKIEKPIILSTGMSTRDEVENTVDYLNAGDAIFALLHCNSTYPAPVHDINLEWMNTLKKIHPMVGYSGHERGISISMAAVAMGASIIERHFTLDREMEGPDHAASLDHNQFSTLVSSIREIEEAKGSGAERLVSQGEMINRENLGKSIVAAKRLKKGQTLKSDHLKVRSPGKGLSPQYFSQLVGLKIERDFEEEDYFYLTDIKKNRVEVGSYSFDRPWGIPVRYHDFNEFSQKVKPDFYEFHLSYSDMDLNIDDYIGINKDAGFAVHAPELFSNSRLMDLASEDDEYRHFSISETQRVIDITRDLKRFFPKEDNPFIIANIGGYTMDQPLEKNEKENYYNNFSKSMKLLDTDGVNLIPQTMAPFPWHFGGQRYQNLFVEADEILDWSRILGLRVCFDVSHSLLTCNHFGIDFYEFAEKISTVTAYLHIGDAIGLNGEGLQIGEGEIDFDKLFEILGKRCPNAPFIPEIWQGHNNGGEGFWIALDSLNNRL